MHFADLDLWLFPRSYTFQGQLSCSVTNISGRELRYVWHWIWEVMRKEFLQKKQVEKSVFFSVWYGEEEGFREYSREERHCVPLHTRPPRIALVSNPAPALLLMARPGFRKAGFFSNREKLPQTRFFLFPFPFLFFPSLPPSFSDKLVDQHCVKKKAIIETPQAQSWLESQSKLARGTLHQQQHCQSLISAMRNWKKKKRLKPRS